MSLRPRYSLITLLVLTALVAFATWCWFKPTRYQFDLTQEWDHAAEHDPLEEELRRVATYSGRSSDGTLVYETRRTFSGPPEFLVAKYIWKNSPLLTQLEEPETNRNYYLLSNGKLTEDYLLAEAQLSGLSATSSQKVRCWVSSQIEYSTCVVIEPVPCGTGMCHVPAGADSQARTSYLLTENNKIYQLNKNGELCDLKVVEMSQVASACQKMLAEEIEKHNP